MIMRKSIFLLGMAALAMASCTNEEVLNVAESNYIRFDRAFLGNTTKVATVLDNTNIASFYVYANKNTSGSGSEEVMNGINVYKGQSAWGYDEPKQWDETAENYDFYAYSDGGTAKGEGSVTNADVTSNQLVITDYTCSGDNDLVTAVSKGLLGDANTPVQLEFYHALSMVKFTIASAMGDKTPVTIKSIALEANKVNNKGTLTADTYGSNVWELSKDAGISYAAWNVAEEGQATTTVPYEAEFTALPQTVTGGFKLTVTVQFGNDAEKTLEAIVPETAWYKGYRYNYIATIDGQDLGYITFAAPIVTEWITEDQSATIDPKP